MPPIHVLRESKIHDSFRVQQVRGMYDLKMDSIRHEWIADLPVNEKTWGIGLIVGPSGSGKSTLAREIFPDFRYHEGFDWPTDKALVDGFDEGVDTKSICAALNSVGFSSPPQWLKPFGVLSNGQKFRAELARILTCSTEGIVFDEFTSVVDRDVAKIGSAAVSKLIRKQGTPPFVAVSCHFDIEEWLDPDWVLNVATMTFGWRTRRRFPEIRIDIRRASRSEWSIFSQHHYLSHEIAKQAECYVAEWEGRLVGFGATIHFPHPRVRNLKKEHRVVVLPDFQGVGIGNRISEFMARHYIEKGFRYASTSSNPAMIHHRARSPKWKLMRFGRTAPNKTKGNALNANMRRSSSCNRITASFEFIG